MRIQFVFAVLAMLQALPVLAADAPKVLASGMKNPESVCLGPDGRIYLTEIGEFDTDGDGLVSVVKDGKAVPFATGLDDPKGIVFFDKGFYVTDKKRVVHVSLDGKVSVLAASEAFPTAPKFLNDIVIDPEKFCAFVSDSGDLQGHDGAVYRIDLKSKKVTAVVNSENLKGLHTPNGLTMDGTSHLLLLDFGSGQLYRIKLADNSAEKIADGFDGGDALTWDRHGQLFVTSWKSGKVWGIPRPGQKPVLISEKFEQAADSCIDADNRFLLVPDMKAGTLVALPATIPGWEVDTAPLPLKLTQAFPHLEWTGWKPENDAGMVVNLRPLLVTHAGDGSNRLFVPVQQGAIHVFPNDDGVKQTKIFLDLTGKTRFSEKEFEEGVLGLAFHPKYKQNGEFFVFYTDGKAKNTNVVSRFKVSKSNPDQADPASEEVLLRIDKPFWNHDGGTLTFGPDGFLYIALGDGGLANDPFGNGQKLTTFLGKILRIDVDHKDQGKNYAIPKDNPFVGKADVFPEIWAYGLRNVWRMAFDRQTGNLWAADVGQNLYEEINLIKAGGNYGWSIREAFHPFSDKGVGTRPELVEPIWEYHHDIGKSITGGVVYRGKKIPDLEGAYLYADFVSLRIFALRFDAEKGRVVSNRELPGLKSGVASFGEDDKGEVYLLVHQANTQVIYRITK
ncbi:MAG: PQQ-dependent sugar dehydrogenase [Planctomycetes bacterium]|nr:PQQ-dependent sugar dehydrogenase [Planctomycetota bacterium]